MTSPSLLTRQQIDEYCERIQLPAHYQFDRIHVPDLKLLSVLQAHHITAIPYENLSLHYAKDVNISLDVSNIHAKLVRRRRGGYCMENNILFHHVLLFFGFPVMLTGARLFRGTEGRLSGWSGWYVSVCKNCHHLKATLTYIREHSVNIVSLPDQSRILADVGYGGHGPKCPLPLTNGLVTQNIGTQSVRLIQDSLPGSNQLAWIYQTRMADDQPWSPGYSFTEIEFFLRDFEVMSFFTSRSADCFLTTHLLVVMFLREEDRVYGKVVLDHDKVKKNIGWKNEVVQCFSDEEERIKGLQDHFGIELTDEEQSGIRSRPSAFS